MRGPGGIARPCRFSQSLFRRNRLGIRALSGWARWGSISFRADLDESSPALTRYPSTAGCPSPCRLPVSAAWRSIRLLQLGFPMRMGDRRRSPGFQGSSAPRRCRPGRRHRPCRRSCPRRKFAPIRPRMTATPPVMYSQPFEPQPSITTLAPELRTANRSPARPAAKRWPSVAP